MKVVSKISLNFNFSVSGTADSPGGTVTQVNFCDILYIAAHENLSSSLVSHI